MKDLIFVTAYCPTEKQEQLLEKCVDSVINCGFHVALISHSHVPIHIQKKCHYYVYDYNNDISNEHSLLGHDHFIFSNKRIQSKFFSKTFYGFAIYRMFSIISQIAINFKYENIHHIEYDCELLDKNFFLIDLMNGEYLLFKPINNLPLEFLYATLINSNSSKFKHNGFSQYTFLFELSASIINLECV
jgi:hypothetical protein